MCWRKKNPNCFRKKKSVIFEDSMYAYQIKMAYYENIFYIKHIPEGKSYFQVKTLIVFLVGPKNFYFFSLLLNWWKSFIKIKNHLKKDFSL